MSGLEQAAVDTPLRVFTAEDIKRAVSLADMIEPVKRALVAHSRGAAVVTPIGLLAFPDVGEAHIKSGYVPGLDVFVVKIATMFPGNRRLGTETSNGLMVACSVHTGEPLAVLHDRKWLTDLRTAAVGAIATDALALPVIEQVAVFGTGGQARLQVLAAALVRDFERVVVWGRDGQRAAILRDRLENDLPRTRVRVVESAEAAARGAQILITTTASREPFLRGEWLTAGQHVTAVGADDSEKRELDVRCYERADRIFVDGRDVNLEYGDLAFAIGTGAVSPDRIDGELGDLLDGRVVGRRSEGEITISKQVGLGVEDAAAAATALRALGTSIPKPLTDR